MKFGPDGRLYACHNKEKRVIAIDPAGAVEVLATDVGCNDLVVTTKGTGLRHRHRQEAGAC